MKNIFWSYLITSKSICVGTALVFVQWLRLNAPNVRTQVKSLVRELDPT